jgi:fructose-1,6-bisphosphatase II / sedoheptulose-1,7-bisphosphatase
MSDTPASKVLDRVLVLEMVRVTEAAAIGAAKLIGRGDEKAADAAAVERAIHGRHRRHRRG